MAELLPDRLYGSELERVVRRAEVRGRQRSIALLEPVGGKRSCANEKLTFEGRSVRVPKSWPMTGSDVVNLIGLGLGTVGGVLLAYDVVYRPGANFQASTIKTRLDILRRTRNHIRESTKKLPCPPYTEKEIQELLDQEEAQWGPEEADLAKQNETFLEKYENRVVSLGALGVSLIVLSFILQFASVLIHRPEVEIQPAPAQLKNDKPQPNSPKPTQLDQ
ncbi:MAG: hypothetical protein WCB58_23325 [Acidobacteriaceae bacterium]